MEIKRVFDLLPKLLKKYPKPDALAAKENGQWRKFSTQEFVDTVNFLSYGLINLGIVKGDMIGIIANNRPEWNFADYASQQIAAVTVPIYPTISEHDLDFILKDAGVKLIFISNKELYDKVKKVAPNAPALKYIYAFNKLEGVSHFSELVESGKKNPKKDELEKLKATVSDNDMFTILYTSGTTGTPKGVMLSHHNLLSNCFGAQNLAPFEPTWRALSFLPLNHVYERMLNTLYIHMGVSIYYAESLETIGDNLKEVQPQMFVTVPRLLEKVYDKIVAKGYELTGIKKKLFFWALDLGLRYEMKGANGWWYELQLKIANAIIFKKWREALGGKVVCACSGGAALQPRLARVFNAAKIIVLEGYGLTETSPVIAVNSFEPDGIRFGTVGRVLKDVQVKIAEDGEILAKGPNIMLGYYKRKDLTDEVIDKEGWFHTGDIGTFVEGEYLKITDRKKEIFKTSGGKYIAPLMVENKLKESTFIEQAMVVGDGKKYAAALIVPAFLYIKDMYAKKGKQYPGNEEVVKDAELLSLIKADIEKTNKTLAPYETVKKIELIGKEWTVDTGEMTPKLSLKRKVIEANNIDRINKLFNE